MNEIKMDIVEINGRSMADIKLMGLLPEEAYGTEDFNLYVRWNLDYGTITVDRSDTDETLITVGLARKGKLEAFQEAMHLVASRYGVPVIVQADPGVKVTKMAASMMGTYLPSDYTARDLKPSTLTVGPGPVSAKSAQPRDTHLEVHPGYGMKAACGADSRDTRVSLDNVSCSECLVTPEAANESDIAEANAQAWAEAGHPRDDQGQPIIPALITVQDMQDFVTRAVETIPDNQDHYDVAMIVDAFQAEHGTIDLDTLTEDQFWSVVMAGHVLDAAESGPSIEQMRAEHDQAMGEWAKPLLPALPIRTRGRALAATLSTEMSDETWAAMEAAIWATIAVGTLKRPLRALMGRRGRKASKRALRALVGRVA